MKHQREDYNKRIQDTAGLIPEDEPVFLFRGIDVVAPAALEAYANLLEMLRHNQSQHDYIGFGLVDKDIIEGVRAQAKAMREWQMMHPSKIHAPNL